MDCLILSYSEADRSRERRLFFDASTRAGSGWGRFLHINYVDYQNDIVLPNHIASIAQLSKDNRVARKTPDGRLDYRDISTYSAWKIPLLGGLYLYQHLKDQGFDVDIIQHAQLEPEKLEAALQSGPKVIAISTTLILNPIDISQIVRYCRSQAPDAFIVLGGMSVWNTYLSNQQNPNLFKALRADGVIVDARGFQTLAQLVKRVKLGESLADVANLIVYPRASNADPMVTARSEEPFDFTANRMKWDLIESRLVQNISLIRTQISCPFACSFCSYPVTQGEVITMGMELFDLELQALQKRGVTHLLFVDDTFNVPKQRFRDMLNILKKYSFTWYAFIRCQYLDKEDATAMSESGCGGAFLGIESANDRILQAMNKRATQADFRHGVDLLAARNITTYGSFVVGFPGETDESIRDSIRFIEESGLDFYNTKVFYYEHSTPVYHTREKLGLTGQGMNWAHSTMTSDAAFSRVEDMIKTIKTPYIPQHSGEIWEIAYFHEKGFKNSTLKTLYGGFTQMLKDELNREPQRIARQAKLIAEIQQALP